MTLEAAQSNKASKPAVQPEFPARLRFAVWPWIHGSVQPSEFCWDLFVLDIQVDESVHWQFFYCSNVPRLAKAEENDPA